MNCAVSYLYGLDNCPDFHTELTTEKLIQLYPNETLILAEIIDIVDKEREKENNLTFCMMYR